MFGKPFPSGNLKSEALKPPAEPVDMGMLEPVPVAVIGRADARAERPIRAAETIVPYIMKNDYV